MVRQFGFRSYIQPHTLLSVFPIRFHARLSFWPANHPRFVFGNVLKVFTRTIVGLSLTPLVRLAPVTNWNVVEKLGYLRVEKSRDLRIAWSCYTGMLARRPFDVAENFRPRASRARDWIVPRSRSFPTSVAFVFCSTLTILSQSSFRPIQDARSPPPTCRPCNPSQSREMDRLQGSHYRWRIWACDRHGHVWLRVIDWLTDWCWWLPDWHVLGSALLACYSWTRKWSSRPSEVHFVHPLTFHQRDLVFVVASKYHLLKRKNNEE